HIFAAYQVLFNQQKYGFVKMDVNLFLKYLQVVWTPDTFFNSNRLYLVPVLEYFHPFKHGMEALWQCERLFKPFIAPFVHLLAPESGVRWTTKLQQVIFD